MEYGPKKAPKPELILSPEMELEVDLEKVSTPEELIEAIDFDVLNTIFDQLESKSQAQKGIDNSGRRIEKEKIVFRHDTKKSMGGNLDVHGSYTYVDEQIEVFWNSFSLENGLLDRNLQVLHTIVHEGTHQRSARKSDVISTADEGLIIKGRFGAREVRQNFPYTKDGSVYAIGLDEALTEDIAIEVLGEYLIRTGNSKYLDEKKELQYGYGSYFSDRLALAGIIRVLAEKSEIDKETLRKGFVKAYISGKESLLHFFYEVEEELKDVSEVNYLFQSLLFDDKTMSEYDFFSPFRILEKIESVDWDGDEEIRLKTLAFHKKLINSLHISASVENVLDLT